MGTNTGNPADSPPGTAIAIGFDTAHDPTNPPESNQSDREEVLINTDFREGMYASTNTYTHTIIGRIAQTRFFN
jgi:hypothetical protein